MRLEDPRDRPRVAGASSTTRSSARGSERTTAAPAARSRCGRRGADLASSQIATSQKSRWTSMPMNRTRPPRQSGRWETRWAKRHRRIRARSTTGSVAGAANKTTGSQPITNRGLPNLRSPKGPCPGTRTLTLGQDDTGRGPSPGSFIPGGVTLPCEAHRNGGWPSRLPGPDSIEYRAQKLVLLEIVVDPPATGDPLSQLVRRLDVPADSIDPAVAALRARRARRARGRRRARHRPGAVLRVPLAGPAVAAHGPHRRKGSIFALPPYRGQTDP